MNRRWTLACTCAAVGALVLLVALASRGSTEAPARPAIAGSLPDLRIVSMAIELETGNACYVNTVLGVRVRFENAGASDAGAFIVDVNGAQQTVPGGLAAGAQASLWFSGYNGGNQYATVDATGLVLESDETNNTHSKFVPLPTLPLPCTPTPVPTKQPDPGDTDGDGCSDVEENGSDPMLGGQRDYLNFWDFFDTPGTYPFAGRDKAVSGLDFFALLQHFAAYEGAGPITHLDDPLTTPIPPPPAYHPAFDRGPAAPGSPSWLSGPANGSIGGTDFFLVLAQFGHSCA